MGPAPGPAGRFLSTTAAQQRSSLPSSLFVLKTGICFHKKSFQRRPRRATPSTDQNSSHLRMQIRKSSPSHRAVGSSHLTALQEAVRKSHSTRMTPCAQPELDPLGVLSSNQGLSSWLATVALKDPTTSQVHFPPIPAQSQLWSHHSFRERAHGCPRLGGEDGEKQSVVTCLASPCKFLSTV